MPDDPGIGPKQPEKENIYAKQGHYKPKTVRVSNII
jgi:hypothetical protein